MNILSRYVLRKFLKPFLASFAALCILIFVSQLFDRLDSFLEEGVSFSHVVGYLVTSLPFHALQVLPVACLLGTLFVVGNLARTREYIAGLAGGVPPEKFLSGLFLAGLVTSFLAMAANETVIPAATRYATTVYREKIRRLGEWKQVVFIELYVAGTEGRFWAAKKFNQDTGVIDRVIVDTLKENRIDSQIDAQQAQWTNNGWTFRNGLIRRFSQDGLVIQDSAPFSEKSFPFKEKPIDLVIQQPQPEQMNFKTLKKHVKRLSSMGIPVRKLEVELMMKLAFPFSCFIVVLLGIPLAMTGKGSRAMGIAAGGILTLAYMGFIQFGKAMAQRLIAPWMGAWLGNFVFLAIGAVLWYRMRRRA